MTVIQRFNATAREEIVTALEIPQPSASLVHNYNLHDCVNKLPRWWPPPRPHDLLIDQLRCKFYYLLKNPLFLKRLGSIGAVCEVAVNDSHNSASGCTPEAPSIWWMDRPLGINANHGERWSIGSWVAPLVMDCCQLESFTFIGTWRQIFPIAQRAICSVMRKRSRHLSERLQKRRY